MSATADALARAEARGVPVGELAAVTRGRLDDAVRYRTACNRNVGPVAGIADVRVAPCHLLASEGAVHADKAHLWHMAQDNAAPSGGCEHGPAADQIDREGWPVRPRSARD